MKIFFISSAKVTQLSRKITALFVYLSLLSGSFFYANASSDNYFSDTWNVAVGSGVRESDSSNTGHVGFQYSKPNNFLSFEGRANAEFGLNLGTQDGDLKKSNVTFGFSEDFIFFYFNDFYSGVGFGMYMENKIDNLFDYQFFSGQKLFVGYEVTNNFRIEGFVKHLSNNSLVANNEDLYVTGLSFLFNAQ